MLCRDKEPASFVTCANVNVEEAVADPEALLGEEGEEHCSEKVKDLTEHECHCHSYQFQVIKMARAEKGNKQNHCTGTGPCKNKRS